MPEEQISNGIHYNLERDLIAPEDINPDSAGSLRLLKKFAAVLARNFGTTDLRLDYAEEMANIFSQRGMGDYRTLCYRLLGGFKGIEMGVILNGNPQIVGPSNAIRDNLTIAKGAFIQGGQGGVLLDATGRLEIGPNVNLGYGVQVITSGHESSSPHRRAGELQPHSISIGSGAWLASRVICLADIGAGAVVGAGTVVTKEIPANAVAYGVPARVMRFLDDDESANQALQSLIALNP